MTDDLGRETSVAIDGITAPIAMTIAMMALASRIQSSLLYVTRLLTATMRSHAIACDCMQSQKKPSFTTVRVLENASGTRSGTESLHKVFVHDNCEQISFIYFFAFLKKEEMRSGTHFTQQNVILLFTVVVTKHVWPYFQSRFP